MSCCDDLKIICSNRKTILIGEIGALLHDIGKAHPSFINDLSVDGGEKRATSLSCVGY